MCSQRGLIHWRSAEVKMFNLHMKQTAREFDLCPHMNGIACGPSLRSRAVASSNGATTCFSALWPGFIPPFDFDSFTLALVNAFQWLRTLGLNHFCSTPSLQLSTRAHQNCVLMNSGPSKSPNPSSSGIINLVCFVRLSPPYARFHYVGRDPRSFRVSLSENGPPSA